MWKENQEQLELLKLQRDIHLLNEAPPWTHQGSQTSKIWSSGKSQGSRRALGTPSRENAIQNQGRRFQVNPSRM